MQYQSGLTSSLTALSASLPVNTRVNCLGLPALRQLIPIALDADHQPHSESVAPEATSAVGRLQRVSEAVSEVFLFSPDDDEESVGRSFSKKRRLQRATAVCGEVIQVEALLGNPLRLPLHVQSIQLRASGVHFAPHSTHLVLPPETPLTSVVLTGKTMSAGRLRIHGCLIRCFNLLSEHPVDRTGEGIPPPHVRCPSLHLCCWKREG